MMGYPEIAELDRGFQIGQLRRARLLGDPPNPTRADGTPNPYHPDHWVVGGGQTPASMLVILAGDSEAAVRSAFVAALQPALDAGDAGVVYQELAQRLPGEREHFGFRDGISHPGPRGVLSGATRIPLTTRYVREDANENGPEWGRPGQPLVWPGQFIFGYPTQLDTSFVEPGPAHVNLPALAVNGSFLVFRRLNQDVQGFYAETEAVAKQLPGDISAEEVRAHLIGRRPDGVPLLRSTELAPGEEPVEWLAQNYFQFGQPLADLTLAAGTVIKGVAADPTGHICPYFAHIRKVNPRDRATDQGSEMRTLTFMLLRRGIPFGPPYDHANPGNPLNAQARGLLFVSFQTSIVNQFEILQTKWMNKPDRPEPVSSAEGGIDLVVGQRSTGPDRSRLAFYPLAQAPSAKISIRGDHVQPTGGLYLFAPSLSAVRRLATE